MLAALENVPRSPEAWNQWAFDHRDSHQRIRAAILTQLGAQLFDYQVEPINAQDFSHFLENNSQLHDDMNSALNLQSTNLQDVDLKADNELQAWIRLHYLEHYYAETALQI